MDDSQGQSTRSTKNRINWDLVAQHSHNYQAQRAATGGGLKRCGCSHRANKHRGWIYECGRDCGCRAFREWTPDDDNLLEVELKFAPIGHRQIELDRQFAGRRERGLPLHFSSCLAAIRYAGLIAVWQVIGTWHHDDPDAGFVYLIQEHDGAVKIGHAKNPSSRLSELDTGSRPLKMLHLIPTNDRIVLEDLLHREFGATHIRGEWFALTDAHIANIRNRTVGIVRDKDNATFIRHGLLCCVCNWRPHFHWVGDNRSHVRPLSRFAFIAEEGAAA